MSDEFVRVPPSPTGDGLVERLRYRVNNPSAWPEGFDQAGSDLFSEAAAILSDYEQMRRERDTWKELSDLNAWADGLSEPSHPYVNVILARAETAEQERDAIRGQRDQAWTANAEIRLEYRLLKVKASKAESRITSLEQELAKAREALTRIASAYDGEDGRAPVPLVEIGKELRNRQKIARSALKDNSNGQ